MKHPRLVALLGLAARAALAQAPAVVVRDAGPGPIGRYLAATLAMPGTRVVIGDSVRFTPDSVYPASVVVIARTVIASSPINGDLIVVGGDLFIHPGARIAGQAIAIGGGVHRSMLGQILGGHASYRDFTFDTATANRVIELRYRELNAPAPGPIIQLPFALASRIPTYDRSSGISLSLGLGEAIDSGRASATALGTYRSQTGMVDPSLTAQWHVRRTGWLEGFVGRDTRSNDTWITSDLSNSLNALFIGRDTRNWYRADVGELTAYRTFETPSAIATYRLGGRVERAFAARPDSLPASGPWSLVGRESAEGMLRANPQVPTSRMSSAYAGSNFAWTTSDIKARLDVGAEMPISIERGGHFFQTTIDGQISFPTFGTQSYRFDAHATLTAGDTAPRQRWVYLGGAGTLGTVEPLLVLGGDELVFVESRYIVPVNGISLPFVGSPTVTFRHILGSAGVKHIPALTQIVGLRLSVTLVRAEVLMDTKDRKVEFHTGLSLVR